MGGSGGRKDRAGQAALPTHPSRKYSRVVEEEAEPEAREATGSSGKEGPGGPREEVWRQAQPVCKASLDEKSTGVLTDTDPVR